MEVPTWNIDSEELGSAVLAEAFSKFQVVHLKSKMKVSKEHVAKKRKIGSTNATEPLSWRSFQDIFSRLDEKDKKTWCIERTEMKNGESVPFSQSDFLEPSVKDDLPAYCSFLIQKDEAILEETLERLPVKALEPWAGPEFSLRFEPCLWVFFARPPKYGATNGLQGRDEHIDSISHNGTFHFQLSGTKRWIIRPTKALLKASGLAEDSTSLRIEIDCNEGDLLLINTRLWFHQTILPPQPSPSVSYARDFWIGDNSHHEPGDGRSTSNVGNMTNLEGLYATEDIAQGTIIFKEDSMPECELHRSSDPNCEVVELDDGNGAVVSIKDIKHGEFFCIAESSDEESLDEEDEEPFDSNQ